jgi:hypothetical protein
MLRFILQKTNSKIGMILKCTVIFLGLAGGCDLQGRVDGSNIEDAGS